MSTINAILATQAYQLIQGNKINTLRSSRVTPNFTWGELLVHRSIQDLQSIKLKHLEKLVTLAQRLEKVRSQLGNRSITITSGWRDMLTNQRVGGARLSRHLIGEAVDIVVSGLTPKQVQDALEETWEGGLGYGSTFTHLDIRGFRARFRY
jgi:uncharacterized protein YcbK (DUF882 family)